MKTAFFPKSFLDTALIEVLLIASNKKVTLLYKGASFKGITYDANEITTKEIADVLENLIPYNINDLKIYQDHFLNRVTYVCKESEQEEEEYCFISDEEYYKSFVHGKTVINLTEEVI